MKEYIWLTISTILIMNMCKASDLPNIASTQSTQDNKLNADLNQRLQKKYPHLEIPPLTIVPDNDYSYVQKQRQIKAIQISSPFYEDVLDNMAPLQIHTLETPQQIILPQSALFNTPEKLEKIVLEETYFQQPSTIKVGLLSSAFAQTAGAYSLILANAFRTPSSTIIPTAIAAKTLKCIAIPLLITSTALSYQKEQAEKFAQKHYQPDPLTPTQQVIKTAHDECKQLTPYTQQTLVQTHLSSDAILKLLR